MVAGGGMVASGYVRTQAWVVGDVVVARIATNKLKAFKALTGEDAWEMEVKPGTPVCTPVVAGGVMYLSEGETVSAIDLATQKRLWSQELASCASLTFSAQTLVCSAGGKIVAMDSKKGEKLWEADMPVGAAGMNMPPKGIRPGTLVADETRLYGVLGDEMLSFDLRKGDKTSARLDLTVPQPEPGKDGAEVTVAGPNGATVVVGPAGAVGGGMMMTSSVRGGMVRWTAAAGTLYVGGNGGLFAFDGKTGQRLWVLPVKQTLSGDPVVADSVLYYATTRYGGTATDEKALPKDLPGLHAVKLGAMTATSGPAAPAKSELPPAAVPPVAPPIKRITGPLPPVMVTD